uniref:Uncharacterized protein n=1 Tax=Cupriavidus pinatubonensis (strain JMP 134 / LMG 1197) TaxID=264198 RepID=Q46X99_CUPPJ
MTQTKPNRLLKTRAVSFGPETGWVSYLKMNAVCRARGHARTAGKPSDISSLLAARRLDGRRGPIEYSGARQVPGARLRARLAASASLSATALLPNSLACGGGKAVRR